jgi:lycopene beta-cyclase
MTYAGFLLLFLVLPLVILVIILRKRLLGRRYLFVVGILTVVALMYMAPWDHFAAIWGLWSWENNRTWGIRWWAIPPEEYLFCILEALLAITLTFAVLSRKENQSKISVSTSSEKRQSDNINFAHSQKREYPNQASFSTQSASTLRYRADQEDEL